MQGRAGLTVYLVYTLGGSVFYTFPTRVVHFAMRVVHLSHETAHPPRTLQGYLTDEKFPLSWDRHRALHPTPHTLNPHPKQNPTNTRNGSIVLQHEGAGGDMRECCETHRYLLYQHFFTPL